MCRKLNASQRNWIVRGICLVPLTLAVCSMGLGSWICTVILNNAKLSPERQIHYEKVITWSDKLDDGGIILHLDNESPFSYIPLDNLSFYALVLGFVAIFGGFARMLSTSIFCNLFCRDRLTSVLYWSWFILCTLTSTIQAIITYDIMLTLSHTNVSPPYNRDFFFTNDNYYGFYWLCHIFRVFIWVDLVLHFATQLGIYAIYRKAVEDQI